MKTRIPCLLTTLAALSLAGCAFSSRVANRVSLPGTASSGSARIAIDGDITDWPTDDAFYANAEAVQAVGLAQVTGFVDSGVVEEFDAEEIRAAVEASAREYGKDSIPEAMADWLEETISVSLPDGQTTPRGWHLTWTGASVSSGAAFQKPGFYPADPEAGTADSVVAPIAFVEEWERREDPENQYPDAREEAVRAYARSQGWPCG